MLALFLLSILCGQRISEPNRQVFCVELFFCGFVIPSMNLGNSKSSYNILLLLYMANTNDFFFFFTLCFPDTITDRLNYFWKI